MDYDKKVLALNNSVVLTNSQVNKYKNIIKNNVIYEKNNYKFINNGLTSQIISNDDALAIYTIPYDEGWSLKVDGEDYDYFKILDGLIGVKLQPGEHKIEFKYKLPGLELGIGISIFSFGILLLSLKNTKRIFSN